MMFDSDSKLALWSSACPRLPRGARNRIARSIGHSAANNYVSRAWRRIRAQPIPRLLSLGDISQRPGVRESGKAPKPVERVSSIDCSWQAKTERPASRFNRSSVEGRSELG